MGNLTCQLAPHLLTPIFWGPWQANRVRLIVVRKDPTWKAFWQRIGYERR